MYIIIIIIKIRRLTAVQADWTDSVIETAVSQVLALRPVLRAGGAATVVAYHRLAEARVDLKQVLSEWTVL